MSVSIISWNVAGWASTVAKIREIHGVKGGLLAYLNGLNCDILAIQETKISAKKRRNNPFESGLADYGHGPHIAGWDSYWASSAERFRGFNGGGNICKKGISLQSFIHTL